MSTDELRVPKTQKTVTMWVHPEGPVVGSVFLTIQPKGGADAETPAEVLNDAAPFLVLFREDLGEPRFYNKRSIVRVQHPADPRPNDTGAVEIGCQLHMMDGSLLRGTIIEFLAPESSRLFDYINNESGNFVRIFTDDGYECLVNKAYIVQFSETGTPTQRAGND